MANRSTRGPASTKDPLVGDLASLIANRNYEKIKKARLKAFEDHLIVLDRLKLEFEENYKKPVDSFITLADFRLYATIGQGSFGSVVLAKHKTCNKYFAIKVMNRSHLVKLKQVEHTLNEKYILIAVHFPFIITMDFQFKDNCNIFFVLPFVQGGDMFSHLRRSKTVKEKDAKFYAAQVVLALEYLHHLDIIYRDLKPENVLIDHRGYIKIADLGFCKLLKIRTYTLCGTPEYLAPEILLNKGYGKSADWWTVGIFIYELISGFTPFYADETILIYEKIIETKFKYTVDFSKEAKDLLNHIITNDLTKRYGNLKDGVIDIKIHDWFKNVEFDLIYEGKAEAPFVPKIDGPGDASHFDSYADTKIEEFETEKFPNEFEEF